MSESTRALTLAGLLLMSVGVEIRSAEAKIVCDGPFQIVQGRPISTPYCQDGYLAEIAREYGMRVTASAVRSSASVKAEVCRLVGADNRAQSACAGYRDEISRRPF